MDVHAFFPKHPLLKKHIAYYYFLKTDDRGFAAKYYSFPNITTPVNIHKNVDVKIKPYATAITGSKDENTTLLVQGMRKLPLLVDLQGCLDKITIHFKPLGLNQFICKPFNQIASEDSQLFTAWNDEPVFSGFMADFYATNDYGKRIDVLEDFLLAVYRPFEISTVIEYALKMLVNFNDEVSIEEIARQCCISTKTLERFVLKHIGISPVGFRKIARFRHSLHNKLSSEDRKTLTTICYESNFYDQAYFNNVYKQVAGSNPGAFFKTVSKLAGNKLVFKFLKQA